MIKKWGIAPIISLYLIFPLTFIIAKKGFIYGPPMFFISLRMIFSGCAVLAYYVCVQKKAITFKKKDWFLLAEATLFGIVLTYVPEFWTLKYMSVAKLTLFFTLTPFITFLASHIRSHEKVTIQKTIGLIIGLCGAIPMFLSGTPGDNVIHLCGGISLVEIIALLAVASYAYGWIPVKILVADKGYSISLINGLRMLYGGIISLGCSFFMEDWSGYLPPVTNWPYFLWYVGLISFIGIACYTFYSILLRHYSATIISFTGFVEPFFAALYAWILLGETVSWIFFVALGIVGLGLYIFYQEELRFS